MDNAVFHTSEKMNELMEIFLQADSFADLFPWFKPDRTFFGFHEGEN